MMISDFGAALKTKFVTCKLSILVVSLMKLIKLKQIEPLLWDLLVCFVNGNDCGFLVQFKHGRMRDNLARCPVVNDAKEKIKIRQITK